LHLSERLFSVEAVLVEVVSGIAGILRFDGAPVGADEIAKITGAMTPRGPDGIHHWICKSVALGHCSLRTTPESRAEVQPLISQDGTLVLVMDGRLDNRQELKQELLCNGIQIRGHTDAELVLSAYQLWGHQSPRHLLGDFAFALWDMHREELFCARDHFGIKPFYYFKNDKFLTFASDEEAFFDLRDVPRAPNEDRVAYMLAPHFPYHPEASWLKNILKLLPGHTLSAQQAGVTTIERYWRLEPGSESNFASDLECEEAFRTVFCQAVQRRLRTLGSPALMLSGGLDSASIAGACRIVCRDAYPDTISVIADDARTCTETRNILALIKGYEEHARLIAVPSLGEGASLADLKEAAWGNAHPVGNSILLPTLTYIAASQSGNRVVLDGIDGDLATYTPTRYPSILLRSGAWREAWAECRQASMNHTYLRQTSALSILCKSAWEVFAPHSIKRLRNTMRSMAHLREFESRLINPDFAKSIHLGERLREHWADNQRTLGDQQQHINALTPVGIARGAEGFDRVASRYGIEARHPWCDKPLIEFYVRLPLRYKVRSGWTKYLVRKATSTWLNEGIRWNTRKDHLGSAVLRALLMHSHEEIMVGLRTKDGSLGSFLDMGPLRGVIARYKKNPHSSDLHLLYTAMTLTLWLNRIHRGRGLN
jgi:asparagine synthase (glutamine-hydrolysing)